ncbi:Ig-like domain repeat protein [Pseudokineococcus lusitanus]|uniref:Ig-like domain-containing protein n=1 Tax=Pseudokineococcus lusitanus TaxID=763993 RepID=A0A3N1GWG6_9ACTN|nr:Ig-like domain repeat protein [Pseudokineococcus lusitanus]ROP34575.1 Ig-like domain-containing protein [Pseudokineococcus lusitanus]
MDRHHQTVVRAARAGACALLAAALLPPVTAVAAPTPPTAGTAQAVLAGRVVELGAEHAPPAPADGATPSAAPADAEGHPHAGDHPHDHTHAPGTPAHDHAHTHAPGTPAHGHAPLAVPRGLRLDDGTFVGVAGLEASDAANGEEVRLVVDVPVAVEDAVADAAGARRLEAARELPAAAGSPVADAVVEAAAAEGVTLTTEPSTVQVTDEAPAPVLAEAVSPPRPVTVAVVDMGSGGEHVPTDAELTSMVRQASDYWSDQSAGRVTFALAGTPARYASTLRCDQGWDLFTEAKDRTRWGGGAREHLLLVLLDEDGKGCSYGVGSVGWDVGTGGVTYLANSHDVSLTAHELGHNLSLDHANAVECTADARQDFVGAAAPAPCREQEYGDALDVMAAANWHPGALAAMSRARIGFLDAEERRSVTASGTTVVDLAPLAGAAGAGVKDLSVTDPRSGVVYRLENRQAVGRDQGRLDMWHATSGLRVLRAQKDSRASLALDATPTTRQGWDVDVDRALPHGRVWRSASGGVEVRTTALAGGHVRATVSLARDGEDHGPRATPVTVTAGTADGGPLDAATRAVLDVRLGGGATDGTVTVTAGARTPATAPVTGGAARVTLPLLPGGTHDLVVAYDGGTGAAPGSTGLTLEVARVATTTAARLLTPATATRAAVVEASVRVPAPPGATASGVAATGEVTVRVGDRVVAAGPASTTGRTVTLPLLPVGAHDVVVSYAGDRSTLPSATTLRVVVAKDAATLDVDPPSSPTTAGGQAVVARVSAGGGPATGVVRLVVDGRTTTKVALADGEARLLLPRLPAGAQTVSVSYDGTAGTSPVAEQLTLDVARSAGTTTARPAATTVTAGRTSTVAVTVTSPAGTPTGEVVLKNAAGRVVARATLSGGRATLTQPALRRGTHRFAVEHVGDVATAPSRSAAWTVTVR